MQTIIYFFRFLTVEICLSVPFAVLAFAFGGLQWSWTGLAFILVVTGLLSLMAERILIKTLRATTWKRKIQMNVRIMTFSEPSPNLFVARALFGKGTIFLSQGLLVQVTQIELESLLVQAQYRRLEHGLVLQTLVALLNGFFLKLAPHQWVHVALIGKPVGTQGRGSLSPVSFAAFSVVFAPVQLLQRLGGSSQVFDSIRAGKSTNPELENALLKLRKGVSYWGTEVALGAQPLFLFPPRFSGSFLNA